MSETNLALFVGKLSTDAELQQRVAGLLSESRDDALAAAVKISEEYGMPVTAEELRLLSAFETNRDEVSDEELAQVAGGRSTLETLFNVSKVGVGLLKGIINGQDE